MFKCSKCGECCKNLASSYIYKDLDRGDGVCKYLDGVLCSIYDQRPLKCRIDECYTKIFYKFMSKAEYYNSNYASCNLLKHKRRF